MALGTAEKVRLFKAVDQFKGKHVVIFETISYTGGTIFAHCSLVVERISGALKGAQLTLEDNQDASYGIAVDCMIEYQIDETGTVEIIEQFDATTMRSTTIRLHSQSRVESSQPIGEEEAS